MPIEDGEILSLCNYTYYMVTVHVLTFQKFSKNSLSYGRLLVKHWLSEYLLK